jgi:hypothetical protein
MIVNHSRRFIFFHVPKAAGTSLRTSLRSVFGSTRPPGSRHLTPAEYFGRLNWYRRWKVSDYFTFCFVRDPFERFGSAHRFTMRNGQGFHRNCVADVNDFAMMLADRVDWVIHLRSVTPQQEYAKGASFVGRYESLEEDFANICRRIGIAASLDHRNASGPETVYARQYTPRTMDILTDYYRDDFSLVGRNVPVRD